MKKENKNKNIYPQCEICGQTYEDNLRYEKYNNKVICKKCLSSSSAELKKLRRPPMYEMRYDEEGKPICHICGESFDKLANHIMSKHKIKTSEYKIMFGLHRKTSLISEKYKNVCRKSKSCDNLICYSTLPSSDGSLENESIKKKQSKQQKIIDIKVIEESNNKDNIPLVKNMYLKCSMCGEKKENVKVGKRFGYSFLCKTCLSLCKRTTALYIPPKGEIHYAEDGKIICHECGRAYKTLAQHLLKTHNISPYEYKNKHQLPQSALLTAKVEIQKDVENKID